MSKHYTDGRRWSEISQAWIFEASWNDREEAASLRRQLHTLGERYDQLRQQLAAMVKPEPAPQSGEHGRG